MTDQTLVRIVLASRPEGAPVPENFRVERAAIPTPADGEVLLKVRYLSLDPYMRGVKNLHAGRAREKSSQWIV
jgi:NADPH-dependent curcumin reductase